MKINRVDKVIKTKKVWSGGFKCEQQGHVVVYAKENLFMEKLRCIKTLNIVISSILFSTVT